jgi:hypothetical protein
MKEFEFIMLQKIASAQTRVKQILSQTKNPKLASQVDDGTYEDKYSLTEFMVQMSLASQISCLVSLGLTKEELSALKEWSKTSTVNLRFRSEEQCVFVRTDTHQEDSKQMEVIEGGSLGRITSKVHK